MDYIKLVILIGIIVVLSCSICSKNRCVFLPFLRRNQLQDAYLESFENEDKQKREKVVFAMFYAPWCGYCKRTMPVWDTITNLFKSNDNVEIVKINCEEDKKMAKKHDIKSFPTIKLLNSLDNTTPIAIYEGDRSQDSLTTFLQKYIN